MFSFEKRSLRMTDKEQRMRKVISSKKCNDCGKELPEDSSFCQYCGSNNIRTEEKQVEIIKECISCGKELPDDSTFCQYCGSNHISTKRVPLKRIKKCGNCGNTLPDDSTFCQYCGSNNLTIDYQREIENYSKRNNTFELDTKTVDKRKRKISISIRAIIAFVLIVICLFLAFVLFDITGALTKEVDEGSLQKDPFYYSTQYASSRNYVVEFKAPVDKELYVYIKEINKDAVLSLFVEKGRDYRINLSYGDYQFYFATGNNWLGESLLFGLDTECYMENNIVDTTKWSEDIVHYFSFGPINRETIKRINRFQFAK